MPAGTEPDHRTKLAASAWLALFAGACGGATPLLHPAHTLSPGKVTFGAGVSSTFLAGDAKTELDEARAVTSSGTATSAAEREQVVQGTITTVLAAPGLAPWIGGRAGVAERTEAGVAYTGRWGRIDVRHAIEDRKLALSFGVAGLALLAHPSSDPGEPSGAPNELGGVDASGAYGFGIQVPVLVGYRSDAELVQAWGGLIGTFEQAMGTVILTKAPAAPPDPSEPDDDNVDEADLDAHRFSGAAVLGLAVGLQPIWVAVELTGRYFSLEGSLKDGATTSRGELTGLSLEPAAAIMGRF
jgi:hypothetical protein